MAGIDFEAEFAKFVNNGQQGSAIKDIYDIIPALKNDQIKIINNIMYYAEKYDLDLLKKQIENFLKFAVKNKNLSFMSSMNMKNLLKAYTQEELVKGIKVQSINRDKDEI